MVYSCGSQGGKKVAQCALLLVLGLLLESAQSFSVRSDPALSSPLFVPKPSIIPKRSVANVIQNIRLNQPSFRATLQQQIETQAKDRRFGIKTLHSAIQKRHAVRFLCSLLFFLAGSFMVATNAAHATATSSVGLLLQTTGGLPSAAAVAESAAPMAAAAASTMTRAAGRSFKVPAAFLTLLMLAVLGGGKVAKKILPVEEGVVQEDDVAVKEGTAKSGAGGANVLELSSKSSSDRDSTKLASSVASVAADKAGSAAAATSAVASASAAVSASAASASASTAASSTSSASVASPIEKAKTTLPKKVPKKALKKDDSMENAAVRLERIKQRNKELGESVVQQSEQLRKLRERQQKQLEQLREQQQSSSQLMDSFVRFQNTAIPEAKLAAARETGKDAEPIATEEGKKEDEKTDSAKVEGTKEADSKTKQPTVTMETLEDEIVVVKEPNQGADASTDSDEERRGIMSKVGSAIKTVIPSRKRTDDEEGQEGKSAGEVESTSEVKADDSNDAGKTTEEDEDKQKLVQTLVFGAAAAILYAASSSWWL